MTEIPRRAFSELARKARTIRLSQFPRMEQRLVSLVLTSEGRVPRFGVSPEHKLELIENYLPNVGDGLFAIWTGKQESHPFHLEPEHVAFFKAYLKAYLTGGSDAAAQIADELRVEVDARVSERLTLEREKAAR